MQRFVIFTGLCVVLAGTINCSRHQDPTKKPGYLRKFSALHEDALDESSGYTLVRKEDRTVLYEVETGKTVIENLPPQDIFSARIDGKYLIARIRTEGDRNAHTHLWDMEKGRHVAEFDSDTLPENKEKVRLSPTKRFAVTYDRTKQSYTIHDLENEIEPFKKLYDHTPVFYGNDRFVTSKQAISRNGFFKIQTGEYIACESDSQQMELSPQGTYYACMGGSRDIPSVIFNTETGELKAKVEGERAVFSENERLVVTNTMVFDLTTNSVVQTFPEPIRHFSVSPKGNWINYFVPGSHTQVCRPDGSFCIRLAKNVLSYSPNENFAVVPLMDRLTKIAFYDLNNDKKLYQLEKPVRDEDLFCKSGQFVLGTLDTEELVDEDVVIDFNTGKIRIGNVLNPECPDGLDYCYARNFKTAEFQIFDIATGKPVYSNRDLSFVRRLSDNSRFVFESNYRTYVVDRQNPENPAIFPGTPETIIGDMVITNLNSGTLWTSTGLMAWDINRYPADLAQQERSNAFRSKIATVAVVIVALILVTLVVVRQTRRNRLVMAGRKSNSLSSDTRPEDYRPVVTDSSATESDSLSSDTRPEDCRPVVTDSSATESDSPPHPYHAKEYALFEPLKSPGVSDYEKESVIKEIINVKGGPDGEFMLVAWLMDQYEFNEWQHLKYSKFYELYDRVDTAREDMYINSLIRTIERGGPEQIFAMAKLPSKPCKDIFRKYAATDTAVGKLAIRRLLHMGEELSMEQQDAITTDMTPYELTSRLKLDGHGAPVRIGYNVSKEAAARELVRLSQSTWHEDYDLLFWVVEASDAREWIDLAFTLDTLNDMHPYDQRVQDLIQQMRKGLLGE